MKTKLDENFIYINENIFSFTNEYICADTWDGLYIFSTDEIDHDITGDRLVYFDGDDMCYKYLDYTDHFYIDENNIQEVIECNMNENNHDSYAILKIDNELYKLMYNYRANRFILELMPK